MEVVLTGELAISVSVLVSTIAGTATAGADFGPILSQVLTFDSTVSSILLTLNITTDQVVEDTESLSASLMLQDSSQGSVIGLNPASTAITITDNNTVVIGFASTTYPILESAGQVELMIQVLYGQLGKTVEVNLETLGHGLFGEISGSTMDLVPISLRTLTFSDNTPQTVAVTITPDLRLEMDENFFARLSISDSVTGVQLSPFETQIIIRDDEMVDIGFEHTVYNATEGDGFVDITFRIINMVTISSSSDPVEVQFESVGGSATEPSDYDCGPPTTHTFTAMDTEFTVRCTITVDDTSENIEMFMVRLTTSTPNVTLSPSDAIVKITDDDEVAFSFDRPVYMVIENDFEAVIVVTKTGSSDYSRSVRVTGTVENGVDITEVLIFSPGQTMREVRIPLVDDETALEEPTQYPLSLEIPADQTRVELGDHPSSILEVGDDDVLSLSLLAPFTIVENQVDFTITISADRDVATSVNVKVFSVVNTTAGLAQEGEDYIGFNETVTLSPGLPLSETLTATIVNDNRLEQFQELFEIRMELAEPISFDMIELAVDEVNVAIQDDDVVHIGFTTPTYSVSEGEGPVLFEVEVKIGGALAIPIEFIVDDTEGEALRMSDYNELGMLTLTLQPGQTSVQQSLIIVNDEVTEMDQETFTLSLQPLTDRVFALPGFNSSVVTITDDDSVTVGFSQNMYPVGENDTAVEVCVNILEGSLAADREITVEVESMRGTAMDNDYVPFMRTLTLTNTDTSQCFDVGITNDDLFEPDETFMVLLKSNDTSATLIPDNAVIIIRDDDGVRVSFKFGQYFYLESDGMAMVEVILTGDTAQDVVVSVLGGPSEQTEIGPDRVVFESNVTFNAGGSKEETVSAMITNDMVAFEEDEVVTVGLTIISPPMGVNLGAFPTTVVTIADNDPLTVELSPPNERVVNESDGTIDLCVMKSLQTIGDVTLDLQYINGTASDGSDYSVIVSTVTIPANDLRACFSVGIQDDTMYEPDMETFFVKVDYSGAENVTLGSPDMFEVTILDNDDPTGRACVLSDSLLVYRFSNPILTGGYFYVGEGCERKLVTTCDPQILDLEIRVDFYQNDFRSTKVSIYYEGETVIIHEDYSIELTTSSNSQISYSSDANMASVSIPEIMLDVTRNLTVVTISSANGSLPVAGLCGGMDGELYFPDCSTTVGAGGSLEMFKQSYTVKPSDQILRGERRACGITANDTVVGDPLMTVPIHAPGYPSDLHLCYEIHGAADQYFNLVSDNCTSVNAHYAEAPGAAFLNIIDSMSFVAIDNEGICHGITVNATSCSASVDGMTLLPMSRKRSSISSPYESNGISVRSYTSRVRISVPNCADNSLVMWVVCQHQSVEDVMMPGSMIGPIDMIKFEITRGLNLKETSHGLIGQFWNIPVVVTEFTGEVKKFNDSVDSSYHTVTVSHPSSSPRSFTGVLYGLTWEFESKECLYVGNRQGGPIGEVDEPNDSVIEGTYEDYRTDGPFDTDFAYSHFEEGKCSF